MATLEPTVATPEEQRISTLAKVNEVMRELAEARDKREMLAAVSKLVEPYNFAFATLSFVESDEHDHPSEISIMAGRLSNGQEMPLTVFPKTTITSAEFPIIELLQQNPRSVLYIEDMFNDPRTDTGIVREFAKASNARTTLNLPLRSSRWQGILGFVWADQTKLPAVLLETMEGILPSLTAAVEHRRTVLHVQEAERNQRVLIESIGDAFFALDRAWKFTYVNGAAETVLFRKREELLGKGLWDVYADAVGSEFYVQYHRAMDHRERVEFRSYYAPLSAWFDVTAYPSAEGLSIFFRNVNAAVQAEKMLERQARELELVARVSATINSVQDQDELLSTVVNMIKPIFNLYHAHIYLYDEASNMLQLASGAGEPGRIMKLRGHSIPYTREHSLVARAARTKEGVLVNDVTREIDFLPNPLLPHTKSELAVPILVQDRVLGVLDVQSDQLDHFDIIDVRIKTTLAAQIATALVNARAFEAARRAQAAEARRARELAIAAQVSTAAASQLDLDTLLLTVANLTKESFDLYHAHIYLLDTTGEHLVLAAGAGEPGRIMRERGHRIARSRQHSLVAIAARTGEGVISNDVTEEPDFLPNELLPDTRSEMALPLIVGDRVIGVLDVQSDEFERFDTEDVRIMLTLASQTAVAVENARSVEQILLHEAAIENSTSGLTIADARQPDMPLVYINPAFEKITGYSISETMNRNCRFLQGTDTDQPAIRELRAAIAEGRTVTVVLRNYRKDGMLFYNELRLSPIHNAQGEVTHFVGVQSDITDRMELEIEREKVLRQAEEQAEQERQTSERLRQVDRMKSQFLANMSHELRTPLNSIIGYSEVLLDGDDGELTDDAVEDIDTIHTSGQHLLAIINDILDLAKIEAGEMRIDRREVGLRQLLDEVVQVQDVLIKAKPVTLSLVEDTPIPPVVGDALRLRQIVMNLVNNAVKFTEEGSIRIHYGQEPGGHVYVSVQDTGIGISEEDLPHIFEQFRQVDGSSTRRAGGTGLGLTITRYLITMQGGDIQVTSTPGKGSTFRFTVPAAGETANTARKEPTSSS
jgi:PAS domain S-box-containing protein